MTSFIVGVAGIFGASLRYGLGTWVRQLLPQSVFPFGTLAVNLIGCFVLGWFSAWSRNRRLSPRFQTAASTGLIGSFTTYSAFSVETVELFRQGLWESGTAYVAASMLGGLCLVWLGASIASGGRKDANHD